MGIVQVDGVVRRTRAASLAQSGADVKCPSQTAAWTRSVPCRLPRGRAVSSVPSCGLIPLDQRSFTRRNQSWEDLSPYSPVNGPTFHLKRSAERRRTGDMMASR